jgi:hypothetical protein
MSSHPHNLAHAEAGTPSPTVFHRCLPNKNISPTFFHDRSTRKTTGRQATPPLLSHTTPAKTTQAPAFEQRNNAHFTGVNKQKNNLTSKTNNAG